MAMPDAIRRRMGGQGKGLGGLGGPPQAIANPIGTPIEGVPMDGAPMEGGTPIVNPGGHTMPSQASPTIADVFQRILARRA